MVALLTAIADEAELPTEIALIRSPLTPPPVPRDIQQIQADIKQGLQVVIGPPAMAISSDLEQIISNPAPSVEKFIAQALTANTATQPLSQPPSVDASTRNLASAMAIPVSLTDQLEAPAAALSGRPQPSSAAPMAMYEAAEQTGLSVPLPLGVPFVVTNYLPVDVPAKAGGSKLLNRVDPVDDEEGGDAQDEETAEQQDKDEAQAEQPSPKAAEEASDEADAGLVSPLNGAGPEQLALPQPSRDPLHDHAFDFYRRMVAWE
ncbi:hypothetical protein FP026_12765 [Rhizobium tropici]|uniref:Uncharacterized protein n=1 Tax=Rhizobium tropici TaxID=398 RepID=A0A5B0W390_RHITR|nr:hypothetical protein FP026_12765 [Rhizobium tropici]